MGWGRHSIELKPHRKVVVGEDGTEYEVSVSIKPKRDRKFAEGQEVWYIEHGELRRGIVDKHREGVYIILPVDHKGGLDGSAFIDEANIHATRDGAGEALHGPDKWCFLTACESVLESNRIGFPWRKVAGKITDTSWCDEQA